MALYCLLDSGILVIVFSGVLGIRAEARRDCFGHEMPAGEKEGG